MAAPLSSPIVRDGDTSFIGLQSRRNPLTLKEGYLQVSRNMRLDRGIAQARKGAKRLAAELSSTGLPVVVPVQLISTNLSSLTQSGNIATATTSEPHGFSSGFLVNISGASNSNYNGTYVIEVKSPTTFTYSISGNPSSPAAGTLTAGYPVIQTTYSGGIFGAGIYSSPRLNDSSEYIVLAGNSKCFLWRNGFDTVTKGFPTAPISEVILSGDIVNIVQAFDKLYLFRWRSSDKPQVVTSITQSSGTATITMPAAHGFSTGEVVRLSGSDQAGFNLDAEITVPSGSATTFTVSVPIGTAANTSTSLLARRVCCPIVWDGGNGNFVRVTTGSSALGASYSNLIAPYNGIVCYYNNQLVIASQRDALIVSDVLNAENFDPLLKSFRTNVGSNDCLTAVHPYANGNILCFLRKSIYMGKIWIAPDGVSIDKDTSYLQILTNEVGCSAKQTVATAGTFIYFLSDNGVYRLDNSQIDLALRGNTLPLSEPIADIMATINQSAVSTSQGIYFNNRYYLAVPTGSNTAPNTLIIYNQLNESWESVDSLPLSIDSMVISDYGNSRRLFAASSTGLLYLLEEYESGSDDSSTGASQITVNGSMTTRRYFYGQLARKRLGNVGVSTYVPSGSTVDVTAVTTDPDNTTHIATITNTSSDNDFTIRAPIRRPGTYLDLTVTTNGGRPTIRAISADATLPADNSRLARSES